MRRLIIVILALILPSIGVAQTDRGLHSEANSTVRVGQTNPDISNGAQALLDGDAERGVRLTLKGLKLALGVREHEAALSNLCAGYILLVQYQEALRYCDMLLERNDQNWRAYNNRAVIYIKTNRYAMAEKDLLRGEALRPGAHTLKVARSMYMDAVSPVTPEIEVDDRQTATEDEPPRQ